MSGNRSGYPAVPPYNSAFPDDCFSSENSRIRVDNDIVFNIRMPFLTLTRLSLPVEGGECPKSYPLVYFYIIPDSGCLADDYPCAMIDKEAAANFSSWVNVYSGVGMGPFCPLHWTGG
jgi:hypothetical protein